MIAPYANTNDLYSLLTAYESDTVNRLFLAFDRATTGPASQFFQVPLTVITNHILNPIQTAPTFIRDGVTYRIPRKPQASLENLKLASAQETQRTISPSAVPKAYNSYDMTALYELSTKDPTYRIPAIALWVYGFQRMVNGLPFSIQPITVVNLTTYNAVMATTSDSPTNGLTVANAANLRTRMPVLCDMRAARLVAGNNIGSITNLLDLTSVHGHPTTGVVFVDASDSSGPGMTTLAAVPAGNFNVAFLTGFINYIKLLTSKEDLLLALTLYPGVRTEISWVDPVTANFPVLNTVTQMPRYDFVDHLVSWRPSNLNPLLITLDFGKTLGTFWIVRQLAWMDYYRIRGMALPDLNPLEWGGTTMNAMGAGSACIIPSPFAHAGPIGAAQSVELAIVPWEAVSVLGGNMQMQFAAPRDNVRGLASPYSIVTSPGGNQTTTFRGLNKYFPSYLKNNPPIPINYEGPTGIFAHAVQPFFQGCFSHMSSSTKFMNVTAGLSLADSRALYDSMLNINLEVPIIEEANDYGEIGDLNLA